MAQSLHPRDDTVIVSVVDILNGERFRFPVSKDCYFKVKHLKYEMSLLNRRTTTNRLLIIRDGEVLEDEEYLLPVTSNSAPPQVVEFYLMAQPRQPEKQEQPRCVLDEASLRAAKEWVSSHGSYGGEAEVSKRQYILTHLEQLVPAAVDDPAALAGDSPAGADTGVAGGAAADAAGAAARPEGEIQWINMRIFSRLGVGFLLFVNGSSVGRVKIFFAVSAIYYVIETGIIVYLLKKFLGDMYAAAPAPAPAAAAAPAAAPPDAAAEGAADTPSSGAVPPPPPPAPAAAPAEEPSLVRQGAQLLLHVSQSGAAIPPGRHGGASMDAFCLLASVFLSLVPEWSPHGQAGLL